VKIFLLLLVALDVQKLDENIFITFGKFGYPFISFIYVYLFLKK